MPTVLVPFAGPSSTPGEQDIAIYLRPESNGVRVESTMVRVIRGRFRDRFRLVYLANLPGGFIAERGVVAKHYATPLHFARAGGRSFTPAMKETFEAAFRLPFREATVVGAFEALGTLGLDAEALFDIRVSEDRFAVIAGQSVKHYRDLFIVNYDLPALLKKHTDQSDVFSMLLRSTDGYDGFPVLRRALEEALRGEGIIGGPARVSRVFHYSGGPFEQILDGMGYLYAADGSSVPLREMSFGRFLLKQGEAEERILEVVHHPVVRLALRGRTEVEIFEYTRGDDYATALGKLRSIRECLRFTESPGP